MPRTRRPSSPGEILWEEFLVPMGLTQSAFVARLGGSWTEPKLSAIVANRYSVTECVARDFAAALGTTEQLWLNLQSNYDVSEAPKRPRA